MHFGDVYLMKKFLLATVAFFGLTSAAHAVTPVLTSVTSAGSNYEYTYTVTVAPDEGFRTNDRLVIFDFAGFAGFGSIPNAAISAFTENTTFVSSDVNQLQPVPGFSDNASLPNLVLQWTGAPFLTDGVHDAFQFTFSAFSTFANQTVDGFTSLSVKNNGIAKGLPIYQQGPVGVPTGAVPEPGAWALMILGFGAVGGLLRRNRTQFVPA